VKYHWCHVYIFEALFVCRICRGRHGDFFFGRLEIILEEEENFSAMNIENLFFFVVFDC